MRQFYFSIITIFFFQISTALAQPASAFTMSAEGWQALTEGPGLNPISSWTNINGNPGGCFKGTDNSNGTWYFYSPPAFNTDLSAYYGNYLTFDLKQNTSSFQTNEPDVIIYKADGSKIVYSTPLNPGTSWTTYLVPLNETGWRYNTLLGAPVTAIDMISFLSNVYFIKIRGDYSSNSTETDWLDNVNISPAVLLPIELSAFTGFEMAPGVAQLEWETNSEPDCSYFQIEKSTDNALSFDSIGILSVETNTIEGATYQFNDDNFYSDAYYRLRMVDNASLSTFSNIIVVQASRSESALNVYPNPASQQITVQNKSGNALNGNIICTDASGNSIMVVPGADASSLTMDISTMANGIYFLRYSENNNSTTYRFEVMH